MLEFVDMLCNDGDCCCTSICSIVATVGFPLATVVVAVVVVGWHYFYEYC